MTRPAAFRFEPGQFARLGIAGGKGGIIWRPYSVVSAAHDDYLEFLSVVVPGGAFTTRLQHIEAGDPLYLERKSYGHLTAGRFIGGRDLWLLASGTGVGPFLSMLQDPEIWQRFENIVLAYSVRAEKDLAYRDRIVSAANDGRIAPSGRLRFAPIVTRETVPGMLGRRLTCLLAGHELEDFVGLALDPEQARILCCGNPQMLEDLRDVFADRGLRPDRGNEPGHFASENYW